MEVFKLTNLIGGILSSEQALEKIDGSVPVDLLKWLFEILTKAHRLSPWTNFRKASDAFDRSREFQKTRLGHAV